MEGAFLKGNIRHERVEGRSSGYTMLTGFSLRAGRVIRPPLGSVEDKEEG